MNLADILLMQKKGTVKPDADLFDILLAKKLSDTGVLTTISGNPLSFVTRKAQKAISTKITMFPIQAGSGDPSPTNVRPITGRTQVSLDGCGKNLFDISKVSSIDVSQTGTPFYRNGVSFTIPAQYVISAQGSGGYMYVRVWNADGTVKNTYYVVTQSTINTTTFTISKGEKFAIYDANSITSQSSIELFNNWKPQIEVGSTATTYEPYTPNTAMPITVNFGETVYGGTLDVEKGELTVKYQFIELDGTEAGWTKYSTQGAYNNRILLDTEEQTSIKGFCSHVATNQNGYINNQWMVHSNSYKGLEFRNLINNWGLVDNEVETIKAYLAQQKLNGTPIQICAELVTPITIQLTPEQVQLLKGHNTIWTDGDEIELTYKA